MKNKFIRFFIVALSLLGATGVYAQEEFEVDGIYYNITDATAKNVEVIPNWYEQYSGSVTIPSSVTYEGVTYRVTSIGESAFGDCMELTSIEIPNSVTSIGDYAFVMCMGLTSIEIPNSVTSIGELAFGECTELASVNIGNSVTSIGADAFDGTAWYNSLPDGVVYAGKILYKYKGTMPENTSIIVEDGTTVICGSAFYRCTGLTSITIPNSVTSIGESAFYRCTGLTSITIPNSVTSIGESAFFACYGLTSVTIGNSVTSIGGSAFNGCSGLTNVIIPNSVTSIGNSAFIDCSGLTSVTIGNSVTSIGSRAFIDCTALTDIYFQSNPLINWDAIPSTATCHLTLTDSDASNFSTANANTYADASYTRTLAAGKFGTIMLPFAPDAASLENYEFYALTEVRDNSLIFDEVEAPAANTPYLYRLREGKENVAITGGATTISSTVATPKLGSWQTVGSFTNQAIETNDAGYYVYSSAGNEFNRITKTLTVKPFRAYLVGAAASAAAIQMRTADGETTEISATEIDGLTAPEYYDLSGRRVDNPERGIYIVKGKKVVIK